jgi:hypothetical protein
MGGRLLRELPEGHAYLIAASRFEVKVEQPVQHGTLTFGQAV